MSRVAAALVWPWIYDPVYGLANYALGLIGIGPQKWLQSLDQVLRVDYDERAGCSLAETITADQLRAWKAEHPGAVVVSYVNTTAAVKAETDICCTSSNAVEVVNSIPEDTEVFRVTTRTGVPI